MTRVEYFQLLTAISQHFQEEKSRIPGWILILLGTFSWALALLIGLGMKIFQAISETEIGGFMLLLYVLIMLLLIIAGPVLLFLGILAIEGEISTNKDYEKTLRELKKSFFRRESAEKFLLEQKILNNFSFSDDDSR